MSTSMPTAAGNSGVEFDAGLLRRYDTTGPRYTSYPTAPWFHEGYDEQNYRQNVRDSDGDLLPRPLSLYFHLPFCAHVCFYCACTKNITANRERAETYLDYLIRELAMHAGLFEAGRRVSQIHWGGGTPTFLRPALMTRLMDAIREHFVLEPDARGDYGIEIDPREASPAIIGHLRELGFNRLSIGVQDFDPLVQTAVNRIQSHEETAAVMDAARSLGFHSVNVDLIYGLPYQSVTSFDRTLDKVLEMAPDRLATFNYAHLPQRFKSQRRIDATALPGAEEKLALFRHTIEKLTAAGYVYIGMDHFARPDDELARAQRGGRLQRNFQGYTTHGDCDLIGMGMSAIGIMADSYYQNVRDLGEYYRRIDTGHLPVFRGYQLSPEDRLRREVIMALLCNFRVDFEPLERKYAFRFTEFFGEELARLESLQADGLVEIGDRCIRIPPAGRLLVRNICMAFDAYIERNPAVSYSRTI